MIPLNHLFETLVDHVISLFGDDLKDLAGEEIGYKIFDFLRDHNFQLEVNKKNETKRISGSSWIFKDQKIITLYLPNRDLTDHEKKLYVATLIHEILHFETMEKIPHYLPITKSKTFLGRLDTYDLKYHNYSISTATKEDLEKYLNYIFHVRETDIQSFSVALARWYDFPESSIGNFVKTNKNIIDQFIDDKITPEEINRYISTILHSDIFTLFEIQYAVYKLKSTKYNNKFSSFLNTCYKYEKRFDKKLGKREIVTYENVNCFTTDSDRIFLENKQHNLYHEINDCLGNRKRIIIGY